MNDRSDVRDFSKPEPCLGYRRLAACVLYAALPFIESYAMTAMAIAIIIAIWAGEWHAGRPFSLLTLFVLLTIICRLDILMLVWPLPLLIPSLLYVVGKTRIGVRPAMWIKAGRLNGTAVYWAALGAACSIGGLYAWSTIVEPDVSRFLQALPQYPKTVLLACGALYYVLNAAAEELVFRGILFEELRSSKINTALLVVLQAIAFGLWHRYGIPGGVSGMALATGYGLIQGIIRVKTGGLLAPWVSHIAADFTILALLSVHI